MDNKWYRKNTPTTNIVIRMPVELNAIAPIAHPDSGRKNCSGISSHFSFIRSGIVPKRHVTHCVSSVLWRICGKILLWFLLLFYCYFVKCAFFIVYVHDMCSLLDCGDISIYKIIQLFI